MTLKVEVENVAGFMDTRTFELERGINRVRAPNAIGKSSLIKAIELLILSEGELKGKGHYSNLFTGSEESIRVKLTGDINHERIFRRIGQEDLRESGTSPLVAANGKRMTACFAIPENPLIIDLLNGRDVREYIEYLAGSENYDKAIAALTEISGVVRTKLQHYRDILIRLEELQKQKKEDEEELRKLRDNFSRMPLLDEREIFEDYGRFNKKKKELDDLNAKIAESNTNLQELRNEIESLKSEIKSLDSQIQIIKTRYPRIDARIKEIVKLLPEKKSEYNRIKMQKAAKDKILESAQRGEPLIREHGICPTCGHRMTPIEHREYINKVKEEVKELTDMVIKLKREIEDLEREDRELRNEKEELGKLEETLRQTQLTLTRRETDEKTLSRALKDDEKRVESLLVEIRELSKTNEAYKKFQERQELGIQIRQKEADIESAEKRIKDLKKKTGDVEELQSKYDFIQTVSAHLASRKNEVIEEIRRTFNKHVNELYRKLGFKDFEDIEIAPDFRVTVTRIKSGKVVPNFPLEALSASERITIAIAFLLSAKNEYVRDLPFFVLDEIITSYDPKRFNIIKEYLKQSKDYVIITELATDIEGIEVVHEA